jgi:hypothetical protein
MKYVSPAVQALVVHIYVRTYTHIEGGDLHKTNFLIPWDPKLTRHIKPFENHKEFQ